MNGAALAPDRSHADPMPQPEITIYSAPKAFADHIGVIQANAIRSWVALGPRVEVVLLGKDGGIAEIASKLGIRHIPDIATNEFGTPLLNSLMATAEGNSTAPYLCMINADIMLTGDFLFFLDKLKVLPEALFIGLRSDLDVTKEIDTSDKTWDRQIRERVKRQGRFRGAGDNSFNGTDYYIYPRGLYPSVPPFAIGRFFWDSWLIADVYRRRKPVVNVSGDVLAVHQNHDYGHVRSNTVVDMYRYWLNAELRKNQRLAGGFLDLMGPREANFTLVDGALARIPGKSLWKARWFNLWYYYPIILRASLLFRPRPMQKFWSFLFPFDAAQGRHRLDLKGPIRWAAYEFVRSLWKLLPARIREWGHIALKEPRRFRQLVLSKMRRMIGLSERPKREIAATVSPPASAGHTPPPPAPDAAVLQWICDNIRDGEKTIAPQSLIARLSNSFGYGFLAARRTWHAGDIDFRHVVIARAELSSINASALPTLFGHFNQVYRDDGYLVLSRIRRLPRLHCPEWAELRDMLANSCKARSTDIIGVLNVWKRPSLLRRQIEGLLAQTAVPKEIWVCAFGVDDPGVYEGTVREFCDPNIHFIGSTKNFKYHGRFQLALNSADASYVAFIDDDIMIGRDFLRRCKAVIETTPDAGEVGVYGWRRLPGPDGNAKIGRYTGGEWIYHLPPERLDSQMGLVEVDLLCGFHFLRTADVRYLFRDLPWTLSSGEDFQLAFALRKYAGLKSYVIPIEPNDPDTWGLSEDWTGLRFNPTTVGDMDAIRDTQYWRLLNRGHSVEWMKEQAQDGVPSLVVVFSTAEEARLLREAVDKELAANDKTRVLALYCGPERELAAAAVKAFGGLDPNDQLEHVWSWLDMELGAGSAAGQLQRSRAVDAIYGFGALFDALKPDKVLVAASRDPVIAAAARIACDGREIMLVAK